MLKKPQGTYDIATGVYTPAPTQDFRELLQFSLSPPPTSTQNSSSSSNANVFPPAPAGPQQHLHYGGTPTKTNGGIGCKPATARTFRQQQRYELMVKMETSQIPDHMAAPMLGISLTRYKQIKKSFEYLKVRMELTLGIIVDKGQRLEVVREQRKEVLTQMLPDALKVIAHVVSQPTPLLSLQDKKLQVAVAQDLLDREGSLAKVSKSEIRQVDEFNWKSLDDSNKSVFDVIRGAAQKNMQINASRIQDTINLSADFSNSKTIDVKEQQAALSELEAEAIARAVSSGRVDA